MRKSRLFCVLGLLLTTLSVSAQQILDVEPGVGTLNDAIKQHKGDRIYRLKDGYNGYYVLTEEINHDYPLTIIGGGTPDGNDEKPTMPATLQTNGVNGTPFSYMFVSNDHLTLKGLYLCNATADGIFNSEFLIRINGNNVRVTMDKCVMDPAGNPIYALGGRPKIYITNCLMNRLTNQTTSVNGPVNFYFANKESGVDTLFVENNTFIGLSTTLFSDDNAPVKSNFTWINHNTFIHHKAQIDWMSNQEKFFFTNNLLYDCHAIPYEQSWVGGWDNYPSGGVSELLWSHPSSTNIKDDGKEIAWGFDKMTSFVAYNIEFKNPKFHQNLTDIHTWAKANSKSCKFYFQPLVWTADAPAEGIDLNFALENNPQSKIYNSTEYPTWKATTNRYNIDPTFVDPKIKEHSDIFAQWVVPAVRKDYFSDNSVGIDFTKLNWYWDPDSDIGVNETWPLFNGAYSNAEAMSYGIDGLPAGDLNWFPALKRSFQENNKEIMTHILALKTERMNLAPRTSWDFSDGAQGWKALGSEGDKRDINLTWEPSKIKMDYVNNRPEADRLWFAAIKADNLDFAAEDLPYFNISYQTEGWPTTDPVKFLITCSNENNELVYGFTDIDPTKGNLSVKIADVDPTWGKPYTGKMKSIELELPHNSATVGSRQGWIGASTTISKIELTQTTDIASAEVSLSPVVLSPSVTATSFNIVGEIEGLVTITNMAGAVIRTVVSGQKSIFVGDLAKGMYMVTATCKGKPYTLKLMVE